MHARSNNLHDGARSAPEICAIFRRLAVNLSYFQKPNQPCSTGYSGAVLLPSQAGGTHSFMEQLPSATTNKEEYDAAVALAAFSPSRGGCWGAPGTPRKGESLGARWLECLAGPSCSMPGRQGMEQVIEQKAAAPK